MPSIAPPIPDVRPVQTSLLAPRLAVTLGLAALADWLFYNERIGISLALFAVVLMGCSLLANRAASSSRRSLLAVVIAVAGIIPAIEELNLLSLALLVLALGVAVSIGTNPGLYGLADRTRALRELLLFGPFRLIRDVAGSVSMPAVATGFAVWFVPVVLGAVFVALFASANPLIEKWFALLNPGNAASQVNLTRMLFWIAMLSVVWPFIQVRWRRKAVTPAAAIEPVAEESSTRSDGNLVDFFGTATILRSLILFNLLFAVQTILDVIYLWGNAALPADITYAAYAHRGAYPLIVTALLAAGFVLIAMRPGGPAEQSPVIRPLVYLWVAQNVMLVISSMLRLDLYVQTYLLTYWRIAAFIWMLLVAVGLVLIVVRIALRYSDEWLIRANLITLFGTLYICSLVNFAAIMANYNVSHSRQAGGKGVSVDMHYLTLLGPQALPAIDKALQLRYVADPSLVSHRNCLVERLQQDMNSWRAWSFRSWRLQRYIATREQQQVPAS
ncbi:DUF4173 domain-containing protein [Bradyrhizobium lablabi]|uniref:DUF4153 domain-containing protein n=1 Tax=Bradyrhizobium lablabi TaxID=722472 RepID=UPI001BA548C6|nr:DUF4173 domain-containing protein [Bradyrhizobium lablabi]MBR1120013.1 DUF4173 domain-containing protein [Bradyrhizobium lablabi]